MRKYKILIVEDSVPTALYIRDVIAEKGYLATNMVTTGEDAVKSVKKEEPDLILMDIILAGKMDGVDAAEIIKQDYNIPVIFITGNTDPSTLQKAKKTAPHGYIIKPVNDYELLSVIETALYKFKIESDYIESEKKFRSLFENMADAFVNMRVMSDDEGNVTDLEIKDVNKIFKELFIIKETIAGKKVSDILRGESQYKNNIIQICDDIIKSKKSKKFKINDKRINKWLKITGFIPEENFAALIIEDISESKISELKINKANSDLNNLLSSIDSILIGVDVRDTITHWNSIAEKTFDIKPDEVIGKKITDLSVSWEWDTIYESICYSLSENKKVKISDIKYKSKPGVERILGMVINPITDSEERLSGYLIYGSDITDKKVMEMQLFQDQKLKSIGELAAGVAHEINTPTQYVSDNTFFFRDAFNDIVVIDKLINDLVKNHKSGKPCSEVIEEIDREYREKDFAYLISEVPRAIEQSIQGLEHISKIVSSMKSFSHPGLENKISVNVSKAVTDTINISKNEWKYVSDVITEFDETDPDIVCFPAELSQVLINIIVNASHSIKDAIDAGRYEKGKITISTKLNSKNIYITISDNGMGIPPDARGHIFDPFFTTKDVGKGSGQGLAIAHSIITQKHGGTINFTSETEKGTSFTIKLPVSA